MILNLPKQISVLMACAAILHTSTPAMCTELGQSEWMQPGSSSSNSYSGGSGNLTDMGDQGVASQGAMGGQGSMGAQSFDDSIITDEAATQHLGQSEWMQSNAQTGGIQTQNSFNPAQQQPMGQSEWIQPAAVAPTRAANTMAMPELKGTVTKKQKYNPANDPSNPAVSGGGGLGNLPGMLADMAETVGVPLMMAGAMGGFRGYGYGGYRGYGFRPYGFAPRVYYGGRGGGNTALYATGAGVYAAGRMINMMRRR
jgi:hypothetical protein